MSRYRQLRKQLRKGIAPPDISGLASPDPSARGRAARSCCPCRVGWTHYEANREAVEALCKDDDPVVRFNALHVRDDAVQAEALRERNERALDAERVRFERRVAKRVDADRRASARFKRV